MSRSPDAVRKLWARALENLQKILAKEIPEGDSELNFTRGEWQRSQSQDE